MHRDDAQREQRDGAEEQPDVERVELHHEQRVEREEHDLEDEHRDRDATQRERRVDVGFVRDDLGGDVQAGADADERAEQDDVPVAPRRSRGRGGVRAPCPTAS